ncbi:MAG: hypothetical protein JXR63_03980 [Spirochaetales bacterium]|nr:hypothetical protein [Spirochaetales bacterium]
MKKRNLFIIFILIIINISAQEVYLSDGESFDVRFSTPKEFEIESTLEGAGFASLINFEKKILFTVYAYCGVFYSNVYKNHAESLGKDKNNTPINLEGIIIPIENIWAYLIPVGNDEFKIYIYLDTPTVSKINIYTNAIKNFQKEYTIKKLTELINTIAANNAKP